MHNEPRGKVLLDSMTREEKNRISHEAGFGSCIYCGDACNWKKMKDINYAEGRGMFPVCEECFDALDLHTIERCIDMLVHQWQNPRHWKEPAMPMKEADEISARAKETAWQMKGCPQRHLATKR